MAYQPAEPPVPVSAAGAPGAAAGAPKTCPSSACGEGALLLGVMTGSGKLAYLNPPVQVDAGFAAREAARGTPERRYRFAGPCLEGGCPQWTGRGCAIADMAAGPVDLGLPTSPGTLPACGIRHSCRWYFQRGPAACAVCPLIVADMGGTDTYQSVKAEAYGHDPDTRHVHPAGVQPHPEVDAIDPEVDVIRARQITLSEPPVLLLSGLGQPGDRRGGQPSR